MDKQLKVVFMGTAGFAVPTLEALVRDGYHIAGVITAPDKPAGRGRKINQSPVKEFALKHGLKLLQPVNLKDGNFQSELKALSPDIQVVVAFRMLPEAVWSLPALGTINLHASLLPQYRGAAPINHAIMNGETKTGVTTFIIDKEIDTGRILFQESTPIGKNETAGELHDRLMDIGAQLILKTVKAIENGKVDPTPQQALISEKLLMKSAPKIFRGDCKIDWSRRGDDIYNFIRGLSPSPCAFTTLELLSEEILTLKVYKASKTISKGEFNPGKFDSDGKSFFYIAASDGYISLNDIQLEGKKRMTIDEFLRGFDISKIKAV